MILPYDHSDLDGPIVEALHAAGVVRDPLADQRPTGQAPAVFLGLMGDTEGEAIAVRVVGVTQDASDSNPRVRFTITLRSAPWDSVGLHRLGSRVFQVLHHPAGPLRLTAGRDLAYCARTLVGVSVPDENRHLVRVDTYECRVMVPANAEHDPF